jgi:hypothetical protein
VNREHFDLARELPSQRAVVSMASSRMYEPSISRARPFRFFDLPAELRRDILEYLVVMDYEIPARSFGLAMEGMPKAPTDLFLACSQMFEEASAIFYGSNVFRANLWSKRLYSEIPQGSALLSPGRRDVRRRIRNLHLNLRRIKGDFKDVIAPALTDMILCGSLRNLKIGVVSQDAGILIRSTPGQAAFGLAKTSPFQALLTLMADPDLENVELWVSPAHWSIWCPYRECHVKNSFPNSLCLASVFPSPPFSSSAPSRRIGRIGGLPLCPMFNTLTPPPIL